MRTIVTLLVLVVIAYFGWSFLGGNNQQLESIQKKISLPSLFKGSPSKKSKSEQKEFLTLEARYRPEQIISKHLEPMVKEGEHSILTPTTLFYPFVLMEVKYTKSSKSTGEGQMLWGLENGEMVIKANPWETTHGFEDCIEAKASAQDFQIINTLAKNGGIMDREKLYDTLHVEQHIFDKWLADVEQKKLVVQSGNLYRLHFEKPKLDVVPETIIKDPIVAKLAQGASHIQAHFTPQDIERISKAAFGKDFFIRRTKKVYLPVYSIGIKNPDGSIHTTYWNAFTGTAFQVEG